MSKLFVFVLTFLLVVRGIPLLSQQRDSTLSVFAEVSSDDTWCTVTWNYPFYAWEMVFDDGEANDFALWQDPGNVNAVKFTPTFYPAYIAGGRIYVGDGSFPGPFLGTHFRVEVYDDNGAGGLPGSLLDSMTVMVDSYGWVWFDFTTPLTGIDQGSFYLGMVQTQAAPDAAPVGIDTDNPTYNLSYSRYQGNWMLSAYQDFMIRASITGDSIPEPVIDEYEAARFANFDPNGSPLEGDTTLLDTTSQHHFTDHDWAGLPQGYYAFGVRSHYPSGEWSEYYVSNIVGHLMTFSTSISFSICDTTFQPEITVSGTEEYAVFYEAPVGTILLENIEEGNYGVTIYCPGNNTYDEILWIQPDLTYDLVLSCWMFPVENLVFEGSTEMASWDVPRVMKLKEHFETELFPPAGWQSESQGYGWFRTENGSGGGWEIPAWDSPYACSNDLITGGSNDGSLDYLVTPSLKLDYRYNYELHFDGYFDGMNGEVATIEYSFDGVDWDHLFTIPSSDNWENLTLDLSPFSGNDIDPLMFSFHADDMGQDASGWAVDNVEISSPEPPATLLDYYVFLNDSLIAISDTNGIQLDGLVQGESYELCVAARYPSGLSAEECLSFLYTSAKEITAERIFSVYPNPARDFINIQSDIKINTIRLYDALGKFTDGTIQVSGDNIFDIRELQNGLYFLRIQTEDGIHSEKIIIHR